MKKMALMMLLLIFTATSFAHGGRTDRNGCHNDNKNNSRHCH